MTWCNAHDARKNATNKTHAEHEKHGRLLERRSWGVTTLHHYKRISSRDLGWHRRENGKGRETVKLSCFFDQWVKPKNLERLSNLKERAHLRRTPLEKKRNKEHYENLKVAKTWIKSLMDKIEFETTPVKTRWEGKNSGSTPVEHGRNRTWTWEDGMLLDEINNTLPPEERIEDKSLE